jgi:hypothetical protein
MMGATNALSQSTIITYPIYGTDVSPSAAIPASALAHAYLVDTNLGLKIGDAPISAEYIVHISNGVETVTGFHAGMNNTGSAASSTFDLLKNGTTILSSPITLANTDPSKVKKNATVSSPTLADGDILSVKVIMSTNTGAAGPYAQVALVSAAGSPN